VPFISKISYSALSEALPGAGRSVIPTSGREVEEEDLGRVRQGERLLFVVRQ
jgi:hypothetical protein